MKKISVCLATYNGERYIYAQLDSILKQLSENDEIIISDDLSTDQTIGVIKSFKDKRIKLVEHNQFDGPVYNFENALKHISGEIVVLSDQDDIWLENRIDIIREHFLWKNSKICTLILDGFVIDEKENVLSNSILEKIKYRNGIIRNVIRNTYMGCTMVFSKDLLEVALPFPKKLPMHDMWLGILGEIYGEVNLIKEKTLKHRIHSSQFTARRSSHLEKAKWRLFLIINLLWRYLSLSARTYLDKKSSNNG